ncbi:hypothetical protein VTL71DRAFT_15065 [Oculimacula yallundae]|uniref:Uncharacterized protein n=1 Tax=Oculimacula yallundae TaxID=86028 RepID=A0ABR4CGA1_9HELO
MEIVNLEYIPFGSEGNIVDAYDHFGVKEDNAKAPYRIKIKNLLPTTKAKAIFDVFQKYRGSEFLSGVYVLEREGVFTAAVRFRDSDEVFEATSGFRDENDWQWNGGFKARLLGTYEMYTWQGKYELHYNERKRLGRDRSVQFLGERVDNALGSLAPGCIVTLPESKFIPEGELVDVRLRAGRDIHVMGHPVVIVKIHDNEMVNFVICTTFGGRDVKHVFMNNSLKVKEFVEIDSGSDDADWRRENEKFIGPMNLGDLLILENGAHMPKKGWAGTKVYTISIKCLASLDLPYLDDLPSGCRKISNISLLIERIQRVGNHSDPEYFTGEFPITRPFKIDNGGKVRREEWVREDWEPGPWSEYRAIEFGEWINPAIY